MIIVIDAYNFLHAVSSRKKTMSEKERTQFIGQFSLYGLNKGHKIVIVFDGGSYPWSLVEQMKIVQVVYSGLHESADDYIKKYIDIHKAKDLLLVSSDAELNRYAAYRGIPSIDSLVFANLLYQNNLKKIDVKKRNEVIKLEQNKEFSENAQHMLDQLMLQASKNVLEKSEDFVEDRAAKKVQVSKHDRALLKKLKKL